jgi:hypothetical protein
MQVDDEFEKAQKFYNYTQAPGQSVKEYARQLLKYQKEAFNDIDDQNEIKCFIKRFKTGLVYEISIIMAVQKPKSIDEAINMRDRENY